MTKLDRREFVRALGAAGGLAAAAPALSPSGARAANLGKVAYQFSWIKNFQFAGEYVADYKRYYAAEGIEVDLLAGGPTLSVEPVVVSGKALIGQVNADWPQPPTPKAPGSASLGRTIRRARSQ